ncbi:MAG: hypothetical protein JW741_30545 [Sedimentisphaerales bacterium]|nr:hypothetical protein [Sedimentisphaerales bacterium]
MTGSPFAAVHIWSVDDASGKPLALLDETVIGVAITPDGKRVLARSWTCVYVVDRVDGRTIRRLEDTAFGGASALSPDGRFALITRSSGQSSCKAELIDLAMGEVVRTFEEAEAYDGTIQCAAFSPDARYLATGSWFGPIRLWDVKTGKQIRAFYGHLGKGPDVSFGDDGWVVVGSYIGSIDGYDADMREWLDRVRYQQASTFALNPCNPFLPP